MNKINIKNKKLISNAKLNLTLEIGDRDEKLNLHAIKSHIVEIDFFETLFVSFSIFESDKPSLNFSISPLEQNCKKNEDNIIYKALDSWCNVNNLSINFSMKHDDNVPSQRGFGIASSNAGVIIKFLEDVCREKNIKTKTKDNIENFLLKIGSDVPFFYLGEKNAIISSFGEKVTPIRESEKRKFIVHIPQNGSSTKNAFESLYKDGVKVYSNFLEIEENKNYYKSLVSLSGKEGWKLTGSGSAFFLENPDISFIEKCQKISKRFILANQA